MLNPVQLNMPTGTELGKKELFGIGAYGWLSTPRIKQIIYVNARQMFELYRHLGTFLQLFILRSWMTIGFSEV